MTEEHNEFNDFRRHQVKRLSNGTPVNWISTLLTYAGWIILTAGAVLSLFVSMNTPNNSFFVFIIYASIGTATGLGLVGIAEVIKQLFIISYRLKEHGYSFDKEQ
ncbi:hypothetical protein MUN88_13795 [Gracilibacillus caseinilyticus]|uniref:DUF4282 domain-containing protein n=1 Tax=Gracilibacillus caseinilyticus TaxID=2932256 RepID=A0ABY4ETQ0_9BACI|nr:hypothetical protein [Gracilibacillus caseinilyticus]UOQ47147.1 hypothetical protein MUN88_13795 [Gracilibacillus caseinilyticus]